MKKRGYFFSTDALIAFLIVIAVIFMIRPVAREVTIRPQFHYDIMEIMSSTTVGKLENAVVQQLISEGKINNTNNTLLEQLAEFYALGMDNEARALAQLILQEIPPSYNAGIWINDEFIAGKNTTAIENAREVWVARQAITGLEKGYGVRGYSAIANLLSSSKTKYFYLGGYVGNGNISVIVDYNGTLLGASIEAQFGTNFTLYVNGNKIADYTARDSILSINLDAYLNYFHEGENVISFISRNKTFYISGGYIRLDYNDNTTILPSQNLQRFPGITGVINLYSSFYVPSELRGIEIYLHYNVSNASIFMNIGNVTILNESATGENSMLLDNSTLVSMLDFASLSYETVPLRLGFEEQQLSQSVQQGNADVVLITDTSGSMDWQLTNSNTGVARECDDPQLYNDDTKRISLAKCLDKQFIDIILNTTGNRVSVVRFANSASGTSLSNDSAYLKSVVDNYNANGGTCICCALNYAYNVLSSESNASKME